MHCSIWLIRLSDLVLEDEHFVGPSPTIYGHHSFQIDQNASKLTWYMVVQMYKGKNILKRKEHLNEGVILWVFWWCTCQPYLPKWGHMHCKDSFGHQDHASS